MKINKDNVLSIPILYVDDEEGNLEAFRLTFAKKFNMQTANSAKDALKLMEKTDFGLIITDERMPEMTGIEFLEVVEKKWPDVGRIIISAYDDANRLFKAINQGHVHEYLVKPWKDDELYNTIVNALLQFNKRRILKSHADLSQSIQKDFLKANNLIYASQALKDIVDIVNTVAKRNVPILLTGETGTGKEVIARLIHETSDRNEYPFVAVNCAAIPDNLLEDEIFGHEKGAFTDASTFRKGRFEIADKGTLFLDEIGDISTKVQVSLLRILQEKTFERLGGSRTIETDFRLITATNRDINSMVEAGDFRQDLFYRLNIVPIHILPLRERTDDIEPLFHYFVNKYKKQFSLKEVNIDSDIIPNILKYNWPGNVRELENIIQRALAISQDGTISVNSFFFNFKAVNIKEPQAENKQMYKESQENELREALIKSKWNNSEAARTLNIPRTTFIKRAKKLGLI